MSLFRIYVDGSLFYHPHMSQLAITAAQIQEDAENIDSMTLSAPYNHPYLSSINRINGGCDGQRMPNRALKNWLTRSTRSEKPNRTYCWGMPTAQP